MKYKILEIIAEETEKAGVRKYTCVNKFGWSQVERDIADRIVELFAIPCVSDTVLCNCGKHEAVFLLCDKCMNELGDQISTGR